MPDRRLRFSRAICLLLIALLAVSAILVIGCGEKESQQSEGPTPHQIARNVPLLRPKLDSLKTESMGRLPLEMLVDFNSGLAEIAASGVLETALSEGDQAPNFRLTNAYGEEVELDSLLKEGPVILSWYRGGWCPYCNLQLHALQSALSDIEMAGGQLVAISPEVPDSSLSTAERDSLRFEVLSDIGNRVAATYGIVYTLPDRVKVHFEGRLDIPAYNGDDTWTLPLAATFIVDRDGIIRYTYVDVDYRTRAEPRDIVETLLKLQSEGRS